LQNYRAIVNPGAWRQTRIRETIGGPLGDGERLNGFGYQVGRALISRSLPTRSTLKTPSKVRAVLIAAIAPRTGLVDFGHLRPAATPIILGDVVHDRAFDPVFESLPLEPDEGGDQRKKIPKGTRLASVGAAPQNAPIERARAATVAAILVSMGNCAPKPLQIIVP